MNWKIEKIVSKGDYNYAIVRNHPFATKNGYVLEHRIIAENELGRLLSSDEIVHHINENKKDNRPENLLVMSRAAHRKIHAKGVKFMEFKCSYCGKQFRREKRNRPSAKGYKRAFCSRRCSGKFNGFKSK